jgi:hypothetical protein
LRTPDGFDLDATYPWWNVVSRLRKWWGIRQWAKKLAAEVADLTD